MISAPIKILSASVNIVPQDSQGRRDERKRREIHSPSKFRGTKRCSRSQARFYGSSFLRERRISSPPLSAHSTVARRGAGSSISSSGPGANCAIGAWILGEIRFPGFRLRIMAMTKVRILHGSIRGIELHLVGRVRPPCVVGSCNRGLEGETYLKDSHYSYRKSLREAFS